MKQNKKSAKKVATKQQLREMVKPALKSSAKPMSAAREAMGQDQPSVHKDDLVLFGKVTRPEITSDGTTIYIGPIDEFRCSVSQDSEERGWRYRPHVPSKDSYSQVTCSFEFQTKEQARDSLEAEIQARLARAVRQACGRIQWTAATPA